MYYDSLIEYLTLFRNLPLNLMNNCLKSNGMIYFLQSDVHLIHKDEKVGASEATLLQMLKIFPFSYGLQIQQGNSYNSLPH